MKAMFAGLAPLVIGASLLAVVERVDPPRLAGGEDRFVIPLGTASRVAAGLPVDEVFPEQIRTRVGRTVVVENDDGANHAFGPVVLAPGQRWTRRFGSPGEVKVMCSIYPLAGFTIAVGPPPERGGLSEVVERGAGWAWASLCAVIVTGLVAASGSSQPSASGSLGTVRLALAALPCTAVLVGGSGLVVLSRSAPWADVLQSSSAVLAWTKVLVAGTTAFLALHILGAAPVSGPMAAPERPSRSALLLVALAVAATGVAVLTVPESTRPLLTATSGERQHSARSCWVRPFPTLHSCASDPDLRAIRPPSSPGSTMGPANRKAWSRQETA